MALEKSSRGCPTQIRQRAASRDLLLLCKGLVCEVDIAPKLGSVVSGFRFRVWGCRFEIKVWGLRLPLRLSITQLRVLIVGKNGAWISPVRLLHTMLLHIVNLLSLLWLEWPAVMYGDSS